MKKVLKTIGIVLLAVIILAAVLFAVLQITGRASDPSEITAYETDNAFITGQTEKIAHRCGAGIAPEETLLAMQTCLEDPDITVDMYEFDLRLTADEQLVLFHDLELDKKTDAAEVFGESGLTVRDLTVEQLKALNMGARFTDEAENTPYAEETAEGLTMLTISEALDYLVQAGARRMSIEIKDEGEAGKKGVDLLYRELAERDLLGSVIFSSFQSDVSAYAAETYPDLIRSNTDAEAMEFYLAAMTNSKTYTAPCTVLQFPYTKLYRNLGVNFASAKVINYAHSRNIALHYWGVNTSEDMLYLSSLGADGVMTDYPDLLTETYR